MEICRHEEPRGFGLAVTTQTAGKRRYIDEIDALRALAVLLVVLFHAYPDSVPGGFIGVDVFFVISGFVIARAYLPDLLARRITLGAFWAARFRRLSPALLLMLAVVTVAALWIIHPDKLIKYSETLLAQPFYLQNFVFWEEGDYFADALTRPLLHTWSLAVEEQFYLFIGLAVLVFRFAPRLFLPVLALVSMASLIAAIYIAPQSPKTVFYMLPTRLWQLSLGIFAAYAAQSIGRRGAGLNHAIVAICFGVIAVNGFAFSEASPFPGPHAFLTCGATAVALIALDAQTRSFSPLMFAPLRYVGRISYGFYLWHWPPISLWFLATQSKPTPLVATLLMVLAFGMAATSYHLVERPIRERRALPTIVALRRFVLGGMAMVVLVSVTIVGTNGALPLYPKEMRPFFLAAKERGPFRCPISFRLRDPEAELCPLTEDRGELGILVLGDSHADMLDEMLADIADTLDQPIFLTVRNCDYGYFGQSSFCSDQILTEVIETAKRSGISTVLAISLWPEDLSYDALVEETALLVDADLRLVIMESVPSDPSLNPIRRARTALETGTAPSLVGLPVEVYQEQTLSQRAAFAALAERFPDHVMVLSPQPYFCDDDACRFHTDGLPNYRDRSHLTRAGRENLRPMFRDLFEHLRDGP